MLSVTTKTVLQLPPRLSLRMLVMTLLRYGTWNEPTARPLHTHTNTYAETGKHVSQCSVCVGLCFMLRVYVTLTGAAHLPPAAACCCWRLCSVTMTCSR